MDGVMLHQNPLRTITVQLKEFTHSLCALCGLLVQYLPKQSSMEAQISSLFEEKITGVHKP